MFNKRFLLNPINSSGTDCLNHTMEYSDLDASEILESKMLAGPNAVRSSGWKTAVGLSGGGMLILL